MRLWRQQALRVGQEMDDIVAEQRVVEQFGHQQIGRAGHILAQLQVAGPLGNHGDPVAHAVARDDRGGSGGNDRIRLARIDPCARPRGDQRQQAGPAADLQHAHSRPDQPLDRLHVTPVARVVMQHRSVPVGHFRRDAHPHDVAHLHIARRSIHRRLRQREGIARDALDQQGLGKQRHGQRLARDLGITGDDVVVHGGVLVVRRSVEAGRYKRKGRPVAGPPVSLAQTGPIDQRE